MTNSIRFPFLQLPETPFLKILTTFNFYDLVDLSFCSTKSYHIIRNFLSSKPPLQINIGIDKVRLHQFSWAFLCPRDPDVLKLTNTHNRSMMGVEYKWGEDQTGQRTCLVNFSDTDVLRFAYYLMSLFTCYLGKLEMDIPECEDLLIIQSWQFLQKSQEMTVWTGVVSHEEMHGFLERFQTNHMVLNCHPGQDFVYKKCISFFHLHIHHSIWFTRQNLLNMNCAQLILERSVLTSTDINAFLHSWLYNQSKDRTLQYLEIIGKPCPRYHTPIEEDEGFEDLDWDQIVMGLNTIPGSRKHQSACSYQRFSIPFEDGVDLQRADGTLATIVLLQGRVASALRSFLFVVWQHSNPFAP